MFSYDISVFHIPIGPSGKATALRASPLYLYSCKRGLTLITQNDTY